MAKTKISEFSATPGNNTDIDSINLAEGCAPSGINDAIRELMSQLKDFQTGAVGDSFNGPVGTTTAAAGAFTTLAASGAFTYGGVTLSNAVTGTGNMVLSTSPTLVTPVLGTPASGTVTNLTGTASININGTVGATTANTGAFTTLTTSSTVTHNGGTANGVTYLNGSKVLTSGSALTFDGTNLSLIEANGSGAKSILMQGGASAGDYGIISVANGSTIRGRIVADAGTDAFIFDTAGGASTPYVWKIGSGYSEAMRLTSTGLGIGTSSPINPLHVLSAANNVNTAFIKNTGGTGTNYGLEIQAGTNSVDHSLNVQNSSGGTLLRVRGDGNVGIGTSSPNARLEARQDQAGAITRVIANNFNATVGSGSSFDYYYGTSRLGGLTHAFSAGGAYLSFDSWSGSAATERMRLDSSGNLGLGVTPSAWAGGFKAMQVGNYGTFYNASVFVGVGNNWYFDGSNTRYLNTAHATYYAQGNGEHTWFTAPSGTAGNAISFTQAMSLLSTGAWVLGDTSVVASGFAGVKFNGASFNGLGLNDSSATSGAGYVYFQSNGTTIGSITRVGATSAVAYNSTSDQRLKENIVDAPDFGSVIDSIKVRSYDWKIDQSHQRAGFIAQELVTVAPEAVHQPEDPEAMMAVDYSKLVPMLVKEIQSLRQRLATAGIA